jgi:uncharacterized protein (DUF58 family)
MIFMILFSKIKELWKKVVFLEKTPESGEVILNQRRVFTLPNKAGLMFGVVLIVLFVTSINYNLNLGLAITYLLGGIVIINTFYSFRNLAYLHLSAATSAPIFAGEMAQFILHIKNPSTLTRYSILIGFKGDINSEQAIDIDANDQVIVKINQQSDRRGYMQISRLKLQTSFPLGILRAWSTWLPDTNVLVYPAPEENAPPLPAFAKANNEGMQSLGNEDYSGVRSYQQGDPLKHLSWKHIARIDLDAGGTLISKQFSGGELGEVHINFSNLSPQLDIELRLSRMTSWVLEAHKKGLSYAFSLGQTFYSPSSTETHKIACLTALATYAQFENHNIKNKRNKGDSG